MLSTSTSVMIPPASAAQTVQRAASVVARQSGIAAERITAPSGWREKRARHMCIYLAVVVGGHSIRSTARALDLSHRAVQKALAAIEDMRDDHAADARINHLEEALQ